VLEVAGFNSPRCHSYAACKGRRTVGIAGYGDQREMELLVQAGFSPSESVAIYSSHAAKYPGRENIIGTVVPGMQADLLLLDVSIIRKPEIVFKEGIGWDSAKL
jgi:predicted amidohydrolase YtcJ